MDCPIPARGSDLVLINKKKKRKKRELVLSGFCHLSGSLSENKRKPNKRKMLGPCQRTKNCCRT